MQIYFCFIEIKQKSKIPLRVVISLSIENFFGILFYFQIGLAYFTRKKIQK